ncbi:Negative regulator of mitosis [Penicillium subrubescens]|uniref:Negative regulator of mitosis n=1 Tax=Penicillium subrubescens TaxID=1316194 RepID=A0A1Q5UGD6_9EURO|nr:Negative regulator of mitosis [Penicillium subrubescens]KAJ5886397.1 Negative regulator of mitosis [Penicillium subrubescens]OKP11547.1 Negative regulator of mitosis [Penicillium subrubescens]
MATTRSLGLHEPSAVSYLVTEGILPPDPSEDQYKWTTCVDENGSTGPVDDELVWTKHCVVWSRAGVVKRIFRLDPEKEDIRHALFTQFAAGYVKRSVHESATTTASNRYRTTGTTTTARAGGQNKRNGGKSTLASSGSTLDLHGDARVAVVAPQQPNEKLSRALVVVLKSQAHIFFLAGNSHTIPLPFEVESVFATPRGLLFQRKIPDEPPRPLNLTAPPNSFMTGASLFDPGASQSSGVPRPLPSKGKRQSLKLPSLQSSTWGPNPSATSDLPRVFSLIDPHSEMGLVVTSAASRGFQSSISSATRRRPSGLDVLDPADEIVYISPKDELSSQGQQETTGPLILVLTMNTNTGLYTVWTARYREDEIDGSAQDKARRHTEGTRSKRRSSHFGMTTGATTPAARPPAGRESFGPWTENWASSQQPENKNDAEDDLVSRVAQDFGDVGVPLKTSRRVSSLLARTDLATSQDRITFSDLATGSQSNAAPHHGGLRQSIGAASARGSFGFNPRASLPPAAGSIYSTAGSFVDAPVDRLLEELNSGGLSEGFENIALRESASGLPEELLLSKVESFSAMFSGSFRGSIQHVSSRHLRVCTLSSSDYTSTQNGNVRSVAICIVDQDSQNMSIVNLRAERVATSKSRKMAKKTRTEKRRPLLVHATGIQHIPNVWDACSVTDGETSRILTLTVLENGQRELSLQTLWGSPTKIDIPCPLQLFEPHGVSASKLVNRSRESGVNRVMADPDLVFNAFDHSCSRGKVDLIDTEKQRHRLQIRMEPRNELVKKILNVCKFVLRDTEKAGDGMLVAWWEVIKWLQGREEVENDLEWTAMVIVLFSLAVPFIKQSQPQTPARRTRRKKGLLRSSSGSYIDLESWEAMLDLESGSSGVVAPWMNSSAWGWIVEQDAIADMAAREATRTPKNEQPNASRSTYRHNSYLLRCMSLSREFLQSPLGARATGRDGYLPISGAFAENTRCTALGTILVGLHLLREEQKLSTSDTEESQQPLGLLAPILAQLGGWLGWQSWNWSEDSYYGTEMASMERWQFEDTRITQLNFPAEPFPPPSIFSFLIEATRQGPSPFLTLLDVVNASDRTPRKGRLWKECFNVTPRSLALTGFLSDVHRVSTPLEKIQLLHRWGLTKSIIDTFPEGVSAPLYEAVMHCQNEASTSWNATLLELIDREDLYMSMNPVQAKSFAVPQQPVVSHDALRDFHNISSSSLEIDANHAFEASAEADRFSVTRLVFREDRRYVEAGRLLNQSRAPVADCVPEPEWTDSELLEAQKEIVQLVSFRTLSTPAGRGMLYFSGRLPLLTEKLPIPSFSLQCVMKPSNVTVSAERSAFTEEKVCWAFFHNGVSTGLAISKASKGIDTSWILFNKPGELTNRHAGFLLALGLNGHLKNLAKWVAFKYLTPKHTMTSIGLLLGLSASYLGTMDTLITRLLSVHVSRMLPMGAAELNLSSLTQTAGIMGIGLLYCGSQHRRMSEVMLSEIENTEQDEQSGSQEDLRDEGYRLAAGFALGIINLAKGKDLRGMRDMHIVERLLSIAVGTKHVDLAHVLDRATAGATIALAIIFMKTNDQVLAQKIDIPDTTVRFDYVRPDLFLLRTLARHLIMWDSIKPDSKWINASLPKVYQRRARLGGVSQLRSEDMPFFNIIAGLCFALGLRYAGSGNHQARDLLLFYLDQFIRISRLPVLNYDARLARNSVRNCQDIVSLSAAAVMAGTGDLALFRRLRALHGRVDPDTPYGSHMAAHMAIGMLFLGGGSYTLGTSDLGVAALLCAFYPIFPTSVLDNKCHLQAFRHLWVLAAEPRCLVPRDLDTRRPISIPITITSDGGATRTLTAPCLLPDPSEITRIEVRGPDHWPLVLDFSQDDALRDKFRQGDPSVYLRRKATYSPSSTSTSIFASTLTGLSEAQDILPASSAAAAANPAKGLPPSTYPNHTTLLSGSLATAATPSQSPWDWIFALPSLQGLDIRERSLVLPSSFPTPSTRINKQLITAPPWLRTSAVDTRLALTQTVRNIVQAARGRGADPDEVRDRVWQLRLLFDWLDRVQAGDEREISAGEEQVQAQNQTSGLWLRRDFIEEARWQIWGVQSEDHGDGVDAA